MCGVSMCASMCSQVCVTGYMQLCACACVWYVTCMCVYLHKYVWGGLCVHRCVWGGMCMCTSVWAEVCICAQVCACVYVPTSVWGGICMYPGVWGEVYVRRCVWEGCVCTSIHLCCQPTLLHKSFLTKLGQFHAWRCQKTMVSLPSQRALFGAVLCLAQSVTALAGSLESQISHILCKAGRLFDAALFMGTKLSPGSSSFLCISCSQ